MCRLELNELDQYYTEIYSHYNMLNTNRDRMNE